MATQRPDGQAPYLTAIRESYDTVAEDYAKLVPPLFDADALGRGMLAAFAELVRADSQLPVADVGCGPGHVTAHLSSLGVPAFGVDLAPRMVDVARRTYPDLRFDVGSMTALELPDGQLGGIVAWWSIQHLPPEARPQVFAEFHRTLAPGGSLLGRVSRRRRAPASRAGLRASGVVRHLPAGARRGRGASSPGRSGGHGATGAGTRRAAQVAAGLAVGPQAMSTLS